MKVIAPVVLTSFILSLLACRAAAAQYDIDYEVRVMPDEGVAEVTITLEGDKLPSKLELHLDGNRHSDLRSDQTLERKDDTAIWKPEAPEASLSYRFEINHTRDNGARDSMITGDWAILRSDKLIPPIAVTAPKGLDSDATLDFDLPDGWSAAAPYESLSDTTHRYRVTDPGRRFLRPKGWLMLGSISSRQDIIAGVDVRVAAPRGQGVRLQDALAFINWTLPRLKEIFPDFPPYMLVVSAGDPMWRGGLSAPNSLFMHADRPLISGNRTSSMIHEMVHIGTSIHGTRYSDWIVEGIAEYYATTILHRSGGISDRRYQETLEELAAWGEESNGLLTGRSSGATTARAVEIMAAVDREIRSKTNGDASLDDIATALASNGGKVTVKGFIATAEEVAGGKLDALEDVKALWKDRDESP